MAELLTIDALVCRRNERALFLPISTRVASGDCIELRGPNGAGKTTLLRTLAGLHKQFSGHFSGVRGLYQGHRAALDELLSPLELLRWYGALQGGPPADEQIREALDQVGMQAQGLTPCAQLSQGQQRRVGMARWLLQDARLWLLDEPYTSLDPAGQRLLDELLAAHCANGGAVLAATHQPLVQSTKRVLELAVVGGVSG